MLTIRRTLMWVSLLLISGSVFFLLRTLVLSNRLDGDLTFSYECCTQEAGASFHTHYWSMFYFAAKFGLVGCAGMALTLRKRTAWRVGIWTLGIGTAVLICCFPTIHGGWFGSTAFALASVVLCSGLLILAVASLRHAWEKLHFNRKTA